ncbi:MAG: hypothetical protein ACC667_07575, partial [Longimicrobiales bacterium]
KGSGHSVHLLLTDRLACPRCGPEFGLVLLAHEVAARRVLMGSLGCANCRERYPIEDGYCDLRPSPREAHTLSGIVESIPGDAVTLGALIGVTKGPGEVALLGRLATHGHDLAALIPGIEMVCVDGGLRRFPEEPGVSRFAAGRKLPFLSGVMRGVALIVSDDPLRLGEAARILSRGSRLVALNSPAGTAEELGRLDLELVLDESGTVVARRR